MGALVDVLTGIGSPWLYVMIAGLAAAEWPPWSALSFRGGAAQPSSPPTVRAYTHHQGGPTATSRDTLTGWLGA